MARPSKMGAGYDAWVLGLHATHVRVCTRALVCRGQGKGWVRNGAAHVIKRGSRVVQTDSSKLSSLREGKCTSAANRTSWMSKRFNQ